MIKLNVLGYNKVLLKKNTVSVSQVRTNFIHKKL